MRRTLSTLALAVDTLVDDRIGIVSVVREHLRRPGTPRLFQYVAQASNTQAFCEQANFNVTAGASITRDGAMAKAIGEAIERYCAAIYDRSRLTEFSYSNRVSNAVDPDHFSLYSADQYKSPGFHFVPFTHNTPARWVPAVDLATGESVFVPAAMVFVPYIYRPEESAICQSISTGLACHETFEQAAINALCEVVERDAFCIAWQACISAPRVIETGIGDINTQLLQEFRKCGREVSLHYLTRDIPISVIMAVQRSNSEELPSLAVAAASAPGPREAVRKSLEELALTSQYMEDLLAEDSSFESGNPNDFVVDQRSHLRFWCNPKHRSSASFLTASKISIGISDMVDASVKDAAETLVKLVDSVKRCGFRVLAVDVTTSDVRSLGLHVVRVLIPGLHPLCMGHRYRPLGGTRLRDVFLSKFVSDEGNRSNLLPHPYP